MNPFNRIILIAGIAVVAVTGFKVQAAAPEFTMQRLLQGTLLCVTNGVTLAYTNQNYWYYSYQAGTNVLGGNTNSSGVSNPGSISPAVLTPDAYGSASQNTSLQIVLGYTNNLFLPKDMNPTIPNSVWPLTNVVPKIPAAPGVWNITVAVKAIRGLYPFNFADTGTNTISTFVWNFAYTNNVNATTADKTLVISTNLPASLLQGTTGLEWQFTPQSGGTNTAVIVSGVNLITPRY